MNWCAYCGAVKPPHKADCALHPDNSDMLEDSWAKYRVNARHSIIEAAKAYHEAAPVKPFVAGVTYIPPSGKVVGGEEVSCAVAAALDAWFTEGHWTDAFEAQFARWLGVRRASFCNSGSSADLLAMSALGGAHEWFLPKGSVVLTAACGFPTTLNAIIHAGYIPTLCDVELGTYVPSQAELEEQSNGVRAIFMAHTLGNPLPLSVGLLHDLAKRRVHLVEDNCDSLGSTLRGRKTGTFGLMATHSFYPAHHITTGEGGMVVTDHPALFKSVESFRDWGRACWCEPGKENTCGKRFEWEFEGLPAGYDHKYVYTEVGYNLKATDMQAAIGCAQLPRLDEFVAARRDRFHWLYQGVADLEEHFILPVATAESEPAWFGFPLTLKHGERRDIIRFLEERRIGTRLLFAGNLLRQPAYRETLIASRQSPTPNADRIARDTFWIGCWPGISPAMSDYMIEALHDYWRGQ